MIGGNQQAPPPYPGQGQVGQPSLQQPSTPIFVAPPPKPQRLLHSEAYLRYIEGLNAESSTVSKWDQTLSGEGTMFSGLVFKSGCRFRSLMSRSGETDVNTGVEVCQKDVQYEQVAIKSPEMNTGKYL